VGGVTRREEVKKGKRKQGSMLKGIEDPAVGGPAAYPTFNTNCGIRSISSLLFHFL
jgi:hypothetical protein